VEWWRDSGAVGWYRDQLGFEYHGPGGLPENFAFNSDDGVFRRLVSTFISPLGSAFLFAAALLLAAAGRKQLGRPRLLAAFAGLISVALLYTLSRSTFLALAGGFVVLALACRRAWPVAAAAATLAAGAAFSAAFTSIAPETHFFPEDLPYQIEQAKKRGDVPEGTVLDPGEPSIRSHLDSLRAGLEEIADHPQGYGLGNAGAVSRRFDTDLRAGESNYTEIGVETGVGGLVLLVAWNAALLAGLLRRRGWGAAGVAAVLATVLALGVQTDAIGVPWLAYCVWALGGGLLAQRVAHGAEEVATHAARSPSARSIRARRSLGSNGFLT
jgi:O-antigen ligase